MFFFSTRYFGDTHGSMNKVELVYLYICYCQLSVFQLTLSQCPIKLKIGMLYHHWHALSMPLSKPVAFSCRFL